MTKHAKENNDRTNAGRHERLATGHAIAKYVLPGTNHER